MVDDASPQQPLARGQSDRCASLLALYIIFPLNLCVIAFDMPSVIQDVYHRHTILEIRCIYVEMSSTISLPPFLDGSSSSCERKKARSRFAFVNVPFAADFCQLYCLLQLANKASVPDTLSTRSIHQTWCVLGQWHRREPENGIRHAGVVGHMTTDVMVGMYDPTPTSTDKSQCSAALVA